MGKVSCELCGLSCTSVRSLCEHVVGVKHKSLLGRFAPAKLRELGRVQYFLDTYLKEEPVLGLEYVVERQVGAASYLYTCLLCNVEHEWRKMVAHVTDVDHAESYIYKHHSDMTSASSDLTRDEQVRALEEAAQAIFAKFGRKEIRLQESAAAGPSSEEEGGGGENMGAPLPAGDNGQPAARRREADASDPQNYDCGLCDVKCASPVALCEHLQGNKHKRNLQRVSPHQLREVGRLGYFLKTHLKEDPIIGLEYVAEAGPGPSYKYCCQLCDVETDLLKIVVHITDVDHMDRYIKKHHGDLLPSVPKFVKKVVYLKTLRDVAEKIVAKHGRKDIQAKTGGPAKAEPSPEGEVLPLRHDSGNNSKKRPLAYHEMGWDGTYEGYGYPKTFKKFHHPKHLPQLYRVQYILDTYMQRHPTVGLEYVTEMRGETSCYYTCELCKVGRDWREMVVHVTGMAHAKLFIQQHYSHMICSSGVKEQLIELREATKAIFHKEGRKKIRMLEPDTGNLDLPAAGVSPSCGKDSENPQQSEDSSETALLMRFSNKKPVHQSHHCNVCSVHCTTARDLCAHITGNKHKRNLKLIAPQDVKKIHRLSYFLRQHVKEEPILGLEYVIEMKNGMFWRFFCQLCNIMTSKLLEIVIHITHKEHTVSYIKKHHADLWTPDLQDCYNDRDFLQLLREISVKILKEHGPKDIQVKFDPHAYKILHGKLKKASEASREDDARPSEHDNRKSSHSKRRPSPSREMESRDGFKKALKKSEVDDPPLAKRGRLYREGDQEASPSRSHKSKTGDLRQTERHAKSDMFYLEEDRESSPSRSDSSQPRGSQQTERHARSVMFCLEEEQESSPSRSDSSQPRESQQTERHARSVMFCLEEKQESSSPRSDTSQQTERQARSVMFCLEEEQESSPSRSDTSQPRESQQTERHARSVMFCLEEEQESSSPRSDTSQPRETQQTERQARSVMFCLEEDRESSPSRSDTSQPRESQQSERHARSVMFCLEGEQESSPSKSDTSQPRESQQTERQARSVMFCLEEEQESSSPRSDTSNSMDLHSPTQDTTLEATTAIQELEFHTNYQLLEYLANFQIDNGQDAAFIQVITQNCIKALTRFQEEEAERLGITRQHEALLASASRTLPEIPLISVNEARSPSPEPETASDPSSALFPENDITETPEVLVNEARSPSPDLETLWPVDTADQSLKLLPKNDITDFFSSIKDMDESEVVGVFQRIATTNPEFREMDIPAVIRILKDSGKLKKLNTVDGDTLQNEATCEVVKAKEGGRLRHPTLILSAGAHYTPVDKSRIPHSNLEWKSEAVYIEEFSDLADRKSDLIDQQSDLTDQQTDLKSDRLMHLTDQKRDLTDRLSNLMICRPTSRASSDLTDQQSSLTDWQRDLTGHHGAGSGGRCKHSAVMGRVFCPVCELRTNSPRSFCEHLSGLKHRTLVAQNHPKDMPQLYRVQYILDTYMQSYPTVGLEYVAEMRGETSCYYTCELCKVGRDWREMVIHVTGMAHAKLFIQQHYSHMICSSGVNEQLIELREATKAIFHKEGRKKIRMLEPDTGNLDLPAAGVSPSCGKDSENPQQSEDSSESALLMRFSNKRDVHQSHHCNVCSVHCTTARDLCAHITGNKHKRNLKLIAPQDVKKIPRLSYFLRQHVKEEPILGLEYVIEMKDGTLWRFFCQLCNIMTSKLLEIVIHITHKEHMVSYIKKRHADLWTPDLQDCYNDRDFLQLLREISVKILKEHGPKGIQVKFDPHAYKILHDKLKKASEASREDDAQPSEHDNRKSSHSKRRPSPSREMESHDGFKKALKKSEIDDPPLAKRGRLYREEDQEASPSRPHKSKTGDLRQTERHAKSDMFYLEEDREASLSKPDTLRPRGSQQTERHARSVMFCLEEEQESSPSRSDSSQPRESQQTERHARSVMFCLEGEQESSPSRSDTSQPRESKQTERQARSVMFCLEGEQESSPPRSDTSQPRESKQTERHARSVMFCLEGEQESSPSRSDTSQPRESQQTERHARSVMFCLEEEQESSPSRSDTSQPRESQQTERQARSVMFCLEEEQESSPSRSDTSQPRESQQTERQARSVMFCLEEEQESSSPRSDTSNSMDLHSPTQDATLEATTAIQELEFHTNYQLLEYLANFQIDNGQDAAFIQVITQNCIKALTRFQEEEAERLGITLQHEALLASASRTLPEIPLISVNEARSPSPEPESTSDPSSELFPKNDITETPEVLVNEARSPSPDLETLWPVDTADQSLKLLPENDITDFFFSSIKDMDESEVVGVFQRIATTNPEFRGMDIPTVIRILKDSGKLKS
ncbi:uncharacterized protein ACMZJ9_007725 [Mantella aurantiaca]